MSSRTQCNFCNLNDLKDRTPLDQMLVRGKSNWGMGGINFYRVPKNLKIPRPIVEDSEFHKQYFVSWLMEIPKRCRCYG